MAAVIFALEKDLIYFILTSNGSGKKCRKEDTGRVKRLQRKRERKIGREREMDQQLEKREAKTRGSV